MNVTLIRLQLLHLADLLFKPKSLQQRIEFLCWNLIKCLFGVIFGCCLVMIMFLSEIV